MSFTTMSTRGIALLAIMPKIGSTTVAGLMAATKWSEDQVRAELTSLVAAGEVAYDAHTDLYRVAR